MSFRSLLVSLGLVASGCVALIACGSTGTGGDAAVDATIDGSAAGMMACADLANATCSRIDTCEPGIGVLRAYGTLANCVSVVQQTCLLALGAPNTAQNPTHIEGCATATAAQSCADRRANVLLDACSPLAGPGATGAACYAAAQCQSQYCQLPANGGAYCGTCQPMPTVGASCAMFTCARGQICSTSQVCATPVAAGGTCDGDHPCTPGLACVVASAAVTSGTCQPLGQAGGACDPRSIVAAACDPQAGLFCNATHQCALSTLVMAGTSCGVQTAGVGFNVCAYDAECQGSTARTCAARTMVGQPCDTSLAQGCIAPARCIGTTVDGGVMGMCVVPDPSTCR